MCRYKLLNWMLGSALASVMLSKLHSSRTSVAVAALATEAVKARKIFKSLVEKDLFFSSLEEGPRTCLWTRELLQAWLLIDGV